MAIIKSGTVSTAEVTGANTLTFPHACSGRNLMLTVATTTKNGSIISITYDGINMTLSAAAMSNAVEPAFYRLLEPSTGTHDVVITTDIVTNISALAVTYAGVDQKYPVGKGSTTIGNNTDPYADIVSSTNEIILGIIGLKGTDEGITIAAATGMTDEGQIFNAASSTGIAGAVATKPGATSVNVGWTLGAKRKWGVTAIAIRPQIVAAQFGSPGTSIELHYEGDTGEIKTVESLVANRPFRVSIDETGGWSWTQDVSAVQSFTLPAGHYYHDSVIKFEEI